jgi:hypothetical protein
MRLIDADELKIYISTTFCDTCKRDKGVCSSCEFDDVFIAIDNAPTIDAEPIVHCKDCKHYIPSERIPHEDWCDDALQNLFKEDFYCGFGKRREP